MDLFEYQARELFAKHGVPVLKGIVATTPEEAKAAAEEIGGLTVIKAQVKTGGRGKAGGVKLAKSPEEAYEHAKAILGMDIKGHTVHRVLVADGADIAEEYYFSLLLDRANRSYLAMCSVEGGMEIEQLAAERPEALAKIEVDPLVGLDQAKAEEIAKAAGFSAELQEKVVPVLVKLGEVYTKEDATLVEVNPLVLTPEGTILALDGKVSLDDNAEFRQPEHEALVDKSAENPLEAKAKQFDLNYVKLDGEVGIVGNGAGLVMSTLDVVAYAGENHGNVKPANFLDIGGGASAEVMAAGLEIILGDEQVKSVFVHVFGGITACDAVADGIVKALEILGDAATKLLVVRLDGNNADLAHRILAEAALPGVTVVGTMDGAADAVARIACDISHSTATEREVGAMSIFLTESDRVIVQGMTGSEGRKHTRRMLCAGTKVVAGVNPRKAGATVAFDVAPLGHGAEALGVRPGTVEVPVHGAVAEAGRATGAAVSAIFVPPAFAKGAALEAIEAGIETIVLITEGIPVQDSTIVVERALEAGVRLIGPNCPGIISPAQANLGITPADITGPGRLGLVSKSGTLTYQLMHELRDLGFTTCIGIGGDPVVGTTHIDALAAFEADPDTRLVVMIGEIGGDAEERAAAYIRERMTTPVVAYVAGFTAPEGRTMGHAGAIVSGSSGTAEAKQTALEAAGVRVGRTPSQTAEIARELYRALADEVSA